MIDWSFKFLNKRKRLEMVGWDGPDCEKLWRYNQHYFNDLNATGASARRDLHIDLMLDWVANNRPGRGVGWDSYQHLCASSIGSNGSFPITLCPMNVLRAWRCGKVVT